MREGLGGALLLSLLLLSPIAAEASAGAEPKPGPPGPPGLTETLPERTDAESTPALPIAEATHTTVVHGRRPTEAETQAPTATTYTLPLAARDGLRRDLMDPLAEAPAVVLHRYGSARLTTVSLRGAASSEARVSLEGLPLTPPGGGSVDLSYLPVGLMDRAEVITGARAARLGAGAMGGALALALDTPGKTTSSLELQASSLGEGNLLLRERLASEHGGSSLGVYASRGDGRFRYERDLTPNFKQDAWTSEARVHNAHQSFTLLGGTHQRTPWATVRALLLLSQTRLQVPGQVGFPTPAASSEAWRGLWGGTLEFPSRGTHALKFGTGFYLRADRLGYDPGEEASLSAGQAQISQDQAAGLFATLSLLAGGQLLSARVELELSRLRLTDGDRSTPLGDPDPNTLASAGALRLLPAMMLGDRISVVGGKLLIDGSARLELPTGFAPMLSTSVGAALQPSKQLQLHLNLGRANRFPSLFELYRESALLSPNPGLLPETSWSADLGLKARGRAGQLQLAGYVSSYRNLIAYELYPPLKLRASNLRSARILGLELSGVLALLPGLKLRGSYALTDARNLRQDPNEYGQPLPYRPTHRAFLGLSLKLRALLLQARVTAQSAMSRNRAGTKQVAGRLQPQLQASTPLWPGCRAGLLLENPFNDRRQEDVFGYPLPGRSASLSLRCTFQPKGDSP